MSDFSIFYPTGTTNLIANPSFELNTNGYIAKGSSALARVSTVQARGAYSLGVTPTAGVNDGMLFTGTSLTSGQTYNASAYLYLPTGTTYRFGFADTANVVIKSIIITGTADWQRVSTSWTETGTAVRRLFADKNNSASVAPFYIDGLQLENGPFTSYCDGEQDQCFWNGLPHFSTSTRPETATIGGIEYDLFDTYSFKVSRAFGIGANPIDNLASDYANQAGSFYQGVKVQERQINLAGTFVGTSKQDLHSHRSALLMALSPVRGKPITLHYKVPNKNLSIDCVYDSGLEFGETDGFNQKANIRLIAYDNPYWREEFQQGAVLLSRLTVTPSIYTHMYSRDATGWHYIASGTSLTSSVKGMVNDYYGNEYFYGNYTNAIGIANSGGLFRQNLVSGNAEAVSGGNVISSGLSTIGIYTAALAPDGKVIFAGYMPSGTSGVPSARSVAAFDPTTNTWSAYATGTVANQVNCSCFDRNGDYIAAGQFTSINSQTLSYWAKRNPAGVWTSVDTGITGSGITSINAITLGLDGNLYFLANNGFYKYDFDSLAYTLIGNYTPNSGDVIFTAPDGTIYTGKGTSGLYSYDGQNFRVVGNPGLNAAVRGLTYDTVNKLLVVAGTFTTADNLTPPDYIVGYNGSAFVYNDIDINGNSNIFGAHFNPVAKSLNIYTTLTGTAATAVNNQTLTNYSTIPTYPVIELTHTGTASAISIYEFRNNDTNETLYLNLSINPGEIITIDLRPNKKTVRSNFRGVINNKVLPGSVFTNWAIKAGKANIGVFAGGDLAIRLYWDVIHYSGDGR